MIYGGFRGDVWIKPGEEATQVQHGCLTIVTLKGICMTQQLLLHAAHEAAAGHWQTARAEGQTSCMLFRDLPCLLLQGGLYREKARGKASPGAVSLVLGAGNQLPVVAGDILHKLILEDEVVVCKMNPVNEYLGPHIRCAGPGCTFGQRCKQVAPRAAGSRGARHWVPHLWVTARLVHCLSSCSIDHMFGQRTPELPCICGVLRVAAPPVACTTL